MTLIDWKDDLMAIGEAENGLEALELQFENRTQAAASIVHQGLARNAGAADGAPQQRPLGLQR